MASTANRHKEGDSYGHQERVFAAARVGGGTVEGGSAQYGHSRFVGAGAEHPAKEPYATSASLREKPVGW